MTFEVTHVYKAQKSLFQVLLIFHERP
jgi:hypothetical protein